MTKSFFLKFFLRISIVLGCILLQYCLSAQVPLTAPVIETEKDSSKLITIIRADQAEGQRDIDSQKLIGDVILRQDSVLIFCDSATIVANILRAEGHVALEQNDSINVFSDKAYYDGYTKKGFLYGDTVILTSGNQQLFAKDSLKYDLGINVAYFNNGAILIQDTTYIVSKRGVYRLDDDVITFYDDVVVKDSAFILIADSLRFNTTTRLVTFISPTRITTDSSEIYCESGEYSLTTRDGYFSGNPQFDNNNQQSTADVITFKQSTGVINLVGDAKIIGEDQYAEAIEINYNTKTKDIELEGDAYYREGTDEVRGDLVRYNENTKVYTTSGRSRVNTPPMIIDADNLSFDKASGLGKAIGNVIWQDTSANISISTTQAEYIQAEEYFKAYGNRPLFASDVEGDSLFLSADTLINNRVVILDSVRVDTTDQYLITSDTAQILKAFFDVRIFKSNFQAICDSLIYNQEDSLFYLYKDPIVWSDTSQFVADTIKIRMENDEIHRIYLIDNAFIINSPDEILFNQVKGRKITAYFDNGEIEKMHVEGNAETVYYALDETNNYIGVNKTESSEMIIFFNKNEITRIKFLDPDANLLPIRKTDHEGLKIEGFNWKITERPKSVADLK